MPSDRAWRAAALLTCAAVLASNAWFLRALKTPPSWDDAWYLEVSFKLFHALKEGLGAFVREYVHAFKIKAPLISVLPLPLYAVFGPSERAAAWANQFCLAASWRFIFLIGRKLYGEKAAAGAVIAAALMPLLYGLSRVFFVECAETAAVAAAQWHILSARPGKFGDAARLGAWLGAGLLLKSIFPLYLAGTLWLCRNRLRPNAKTALAVAGLVASTWYAFNLVYVAGFGLSAGFGGIARDYGAASSLSPSVLAAYFAAILRNVLSTPYFALAAALLGWNLWRAKSLRPGEAGKFLAAWALVPFAVLLAGVNKDLRYLAPILPALALALGAGAAAFAQTPARAGILLAALILPASVFSAQTFGAPEAPALAYNGPPGRDPGWDRAALVSAVLSHAGLGPAVAAVALEHPKLNANNLSSLAAERDYPLRFINLGYAQRALPAAILRLKDKDARFLIAVRGVPEHELPGFLNRVNDELLETLKRGGLGARPLGEVAVAPGVIATIYAIKP